MSQIVIAFFDWLLGCYKLSNVDSSCFSEMLNEVSQVLQLVIQVLRLAHCLLVEMLDTCILLRLVLLFVLDLLLFL